MSETREDDGLKVGDEMILTLGGSRDVHEVVTITRLTPTRVTVMHNGKGRVFVRGRHMKEVGGHRYWYGWLAIPTPESLAAAREESHRRRLLNRIDATVMKTLTTAQLEAIVAALPEPKP